VEYLDDTIRGGYQQSVLAERLEQFEIAWQLERWEPQDHDEHLLSILCAIREKWADVFSRATDRF
jgi:hypothetical protein